MAQPVYARVVVKLSGEALAGPAGFGVDQSIVETIAADIAASRRLGVDIALVVGGGNIGRGVSRPTGDTMGMLATVMNSLVMEAAIERHGAPASTLSAIPMPTICDHFSRRRALDLIGAGRVVLLAGGTGNPYFTTDTTAVVRAAELDCNAVLKATNVDGVYDADPRQNSSARRYDRLSPREALERNLKIMDSTAFALARENGIVFSIREPGAIESVLRGKGRATIVAD